MDNFHNYLKKQLIEYVEEERKKGIPIDEIEKILLDAGHKKNIIDEVFSELQKEKIENKKTPHKDPVEGDLVGMLKGAFSGFMAKASDKEIKNAKKDLETTDTEKVVEEVIEEVEVIEEKRMFEGLTFFLYLVGLGLVILFSSGGTDSEIINVIIGFIPAILSVFISFMLLSLADNVPVFVFIPVVISSIFYAIGKFTNFPLFQGLDFEGLAIVNFLIGFLFNILIVYVRFLKPNHMRQKVLTKDKINTLKEETPTTQKIEKNKSITELKEEFNLK